MTLDDLLAREGIRQTMAAYTAAGDRLREGRVHRRLHRGRGARIRGGARARPVPLCRPRGDPPVDRARWREPPQGTSRTHQASFVRHHLSTCHIERTGPDSAQARTYWVAWTDIGPDHAGYYLDTFQRDGERWLIRHRRIRRDWQAADSLFTTAVAHSR